jgi:hypothetical protein
MNLTGLLNNVTKKVRLAPTELVTGLSNTFGRTLGYRFINMPTVVLKGVNLHRCSKQLKSA